MAHNKPEKGCLEISGILGMEEAFACILHLVETHLVLGQAEADQEKYQTCQGEEMQKRT